MTNRDLEALWRYHNATKHSSESVRSSAHYLDWANYPLPFKIYPELKPIPLPREWPKTEGDALSAISYPGSPAEPLPYGHGSDWLSTETAVNQSRDRKEASTPSTEAPASAEAIVDLRTLAAILYHSAGITRRRSYPGGEIYFRAAACTGALYEVELYLVCGRLADLEAGLYHFNPLDFALRKLRDGDYRGVLAHSTANDPAVEHAPVTLVCTGTYWRNAWKYQARTYRHFYWDDGTMLANLLAMAAALRLPARLVMGFVDEEVNRLLSLDTEREVAISMVALGRSSNEAPRAPADTEPLAFQTVPLSKAEVDYPLMRNVHAASSLATAEEVMAWQVRTPVDQPPERSRSAGQTFGLEPLPDSRLPRENIEQVILRRGSTRQFARMPINFEQLSTLLVRATQGIPADFLDSPGARLNDLYVIVNAVEGLPSGAYFFRRDEQNLELLKKGDFREQAGRLGLEQDLPADASVDVFFLADLNAILDRFGNRGYRAAQIEAGIMGGKLYLTAYAQMLGASGLTFYDDEVTDFFSPHAAGKSAIFLVAIGIPAKRRLRVL